MPRPPYKAVALISGGLDSLLAARMMLDQGIHVEGINFYTGFCVEGHTSAIRNQKRKKPKRNNALWSAEQLGIKLHIIDIIEEYKDVVLNPKHGYGANLNPCLDCKTFMLGKAKQWMQDHGFDFIITGEVLGQRPMSQTHDKMPIVVRESGVDDLLLRPLCAQLLAPTRPELEGWVDRQQLGAISGRGRKQQMAMAANYGFEDYATPAGGCCFLTDASYSAKLTDLWQSRGARDYEIDDIMLLKVGRHLRPAPNFKVIISRDEGENRYLSGYRKQFYSLESSSLPGPLTLVDGQPTPQDLELAARLTARYGKAKMLDQAEIRVTEPNGAHHLLMIKPIIADEVPQEWFV